MRLTMKFALLLPLVLLMISCEEEVPDYAADIIDTYIIESMTYEGETFDLTTLTLEDAAFVKITRDDVELYMNSDDPCDDDYEMESDEIEGVTETSILYMDGSIDDYSFDDGKLVIENSGDIIVLAAYTELFPPAMWTDPSLLTNDTYEPNDDFTMATPIAAGGTVQNHFLAACGEDDIFVFSAIAGKNYYMGTSTLTAFDLDLAMYLYTGAGVELAYNDDYEPTLGWNPGLDWTCPTTGDYYFKISGLSEDETGPYSVSVVETSGLLKMPAAPVEKVKSEKLKLRDLVFNQ